MVVSQSSNYLITSYNDFDVSDRPSNVVPMVLEQSGMGERAFDIYSRLLRERIVFLGTPVTDEVADSIVAQLLYLDAEDPEKDVQMYINSPGGLGDGRHGNLWHNAANPPGCGDDLLRFGSEYGRISADSRSPR